MYYRMHHSHLSESEKRKEFIGYWTKKIIGLIAICLCFLMLYFVLRYYKVEITNMEIIIGLPVSIVLMWMFVGH